jgi:hypothetical protein
MAETDLRWRQRFDNFERALLVLERGVQRHGRANSASWSSRA